MNQITQFVEVDFIALRSRLEDVSKDPQYPEPSVTRLAVNTLWHPQACRVFCMHEVLASECSKHTHAFACQGGLCANLLTDGSGY